MNNPKRFLISTDCVDWKDVYAPSWYTEDTLYSGICSDYLPDTRVFITDEAKEKVSVYRRKVDRNGNHLAFYKAVYAVTEKEHTFLL